jgi:hypothetical protein
MILIIDVIFIIIICLFMFIIKDLNSSVKNLKKDTEFLINISKEFKKESPDQERKDRNAKKQRDRRARIRQDKLNIYPDDVNIKLILPQND